MDKKINLSLNTFVVYQIAIVSIILLLSVSSYLVTYYTDHKKLLGFARLLDVGSEQSLSTFISVVNLLLASVLLFIIYLYEKAKSSVNARYWLLLACVFFVLSVDESAGIHENFSYIYAFITKQGFMPVIPILGNHQWLVFGVISVVVLLFVLIPFLRRLPGKTLSLFLISGFIFIGGAVGFEFLGAVMLHEGVVDTNKDILYLIRRIFEEGFEMYGIAIFNCALYREILLRKITFFMHTQDA